MGISYKRYVFFVLSIIVIGIGITLITQAGLGTTAVTSVPYVISQFSGLSFGILTMVFNIIWVMLQILLLRNRFEKRQVLQLVVGPILGLAIDGSAFLLDPIIPVHYITQLLYVLIGSAVLAFGVYMQIEANVIYNPAEGIVYALARVRDKTFGDIKISFDLILVGIAAVLSFSVLGGIVGLREGTFLSALLIGPLTSLYKKLLPKYLISS